MESSQGSLWGGHARFRAAAPKDGSRHVVLGSDAVGLLPGARSKGIGPAMRERGGEPLPRGVDESRCWLGAPVGLPFKALSSSSPLGLDYRGQKHSPLEAELWSRLTCLTAKSALTLGTK